MTCRIAPHHFDSIPAFVAEVHRVLKPGGLFGLVDNVVVAGDVGDFVNAFERFRDPSRLRAWTMQEWRDVLAKQGFAVAHEEELDKTMEFKPWAARHDATMQAFLRAMLAHADWRPKPRSIRRAWATRSPSGCAKDCSSGARAEEAASRGMSATDQAVDRRALSRRRLLYATTAAVGAAGLWRRSGPSSTSSTPMRRAGHRAT